MGNKIIVANWKMNGSAELVDKISNIFNDSFDTKSKEIIICPSYIHIESLIRNNINKKFYVGAQNCCDKASGAFTGEVSADMLKNLGCSHVIVGHSERRENYLESNELLKNKLSEAIKNNLIPIFCCGENESERKDGACFNKIEEQLNVLFDVEALKSIIIAYEPIWSIGTNKTPDDKEIKDMHIYIKNYLMKKISSNNISILYGGSVNPENANRILKISEVDGVLVGGASLSTEKFKLICNTI